jgi:hypothetical protein
MKCMQIMAEDVIPHFRAPDGKPSYARRDRLGPLTRSEQAATVPEPALRPVARLDGGGLVETETAYIPEVLNGGGNGARPASTEKVG